MFEFEQMATQGAKIKVVGVGGSGCNAVNTMIRSGLEGVEFITANTDRQALDASLAPLKMAIGQELTKGLGAGANPEVGRKAALEDYAKISETLSGADMVFITAGMGGGTGTGAAPVFAKIAKEVGALTVGVVTKPFFFEGKKRMRHAEFGMSCLRETVDSLITIPNQRLLALAGSTLSIIDAFKKADEVLLNAVQGISDLINHTGLINSDFADVKTIMQNKGLALMGIGYGEGEHRAVDAATKAISSPLLEDISIEGATGIIINITGASNLSIHEVNEATTLIMEAAHEDAEIIFGTVIDENIKEMVKVTVIATGLGIPKAQISVPAVPPIASTPSQQTLPETNAATQAPATMNTNPVTTPDQLAVQSTAAPTPSTPPVDATLTPAAAAVPAATIPPVTPPQPNPTMLATMNAVAKPQQPQTTAITQGLPSAPVIPAAITPPEPAVVVSPIPVSTTSPLISETEEALAKEPAPLVASMATLPSSPLAMGTDGGELARARAIAQRLGITNLTDDEYDIPTYMRRQQEREL